MSITFKWVEGEELSILEPFLAANNWSSLNPNTCRALCAYEGDILIGFNVLQLYPTVGPLWVDKPHRGNGTAGDLAGKMAEFLDEIDARGYLVIADNPASAKLCESHGMKKVTSPVYQM